MRIAGALAGFFLLFAGAVLGWLGTVPVTCSMNNAQALYAGVPALGLHLGGVGLLLAARPPRWAYLVLVLPAVPFLEQAGLAFRLAQGIGLQGLSVCQVLTGSPFEPSGEEGFFVALWVLVVAVPLVGLVVAFRRA